MMNDLSIMGRLVDYPELKKTPNGVSVATFRIACERAYAKPGEQRVTDYFDVTCWRSTAEFADKYLQKGQLVGITGTIQNRQWEDKTGRRHTVTEIIADKLHFAEAARPARREPTDESALDIDPDPADFAPIDESEDLPF